MMAGKEGLSMTALADKMCVTKGAITGVVKSLMEQGLLTREALSTDKRVQVVRITKPGERLWQEMFRVYALVVENNLSQLSTTEVETITRLLRSLQPAD
jgi:DNA-binding MarR family transcriptional regulator